MTSCEHFYSSQMPHVLLICDRPFYKRSESFTEPDGTHQQEHRWYYDRDALGNDGPMPISYLKEYSASHQYWHDTLNGLGVQTNEAHQSGSNVGVWTNMLCVDPKTMTRTYSATAYYLPNAKRSNLVLLTEATAREIVLEADGEHWAAKCVRFDHGGTEYVATASKEIILSGGSVASPQLLELSGVGNPSVLERAKIPVKVANPNVGEHLQDHMSRCRVYRWFDGLSS